MTLRIERVTSVAQCVLCGQLADAVWGDGVACSTPQMTVHANYGGVVLLAYEERDPVGFLFSFPALYKGEMMLWSHETGVLPTHLHRGIGYELKQAQRQIAAELGYREIAWTYDPLVSRNAYFNLVKLGARVDAYKVNTYGVNATDLINQGVETDRFVAVWSVASAAAATVPTAEIAAVTDIPPDFTKLLREQPEQARELRYRFRETALAGFADGLQPTAYRRTTDGGQYLWTRGGIPNAN